MSKNLKGLNEHGKKRTEGVKSRLNAAYQAIEVELAKNEGLYPFNGGRLSEAEVCRRADVSPVTLLNKRHAKTRKVLKDWLAAIHGTSVVGSAAVRRQVTKRVEDWKAAFHLVANQFHLYKIEEIRKNEELAEKMKKILELEATVAELQSQLSRGKVRPIRGKPLVETEG